MRLDGSLIVGSKKPCSVWDGRTTFNFKSYFNKTTKAAAVTGRRRKNPTPAQSPGRCVNQLTTKLLLVNFNKILLYPPFIVCIFIFSCSMNTTKSIDPVFTMSLDSISRDINTIIFTPEVNISGKRISSNGNTTTELIINLINRNNLPSDTSEQNTLGQNIATLLKHALKDPNSFTDYKVLFTRKVIDGSSTKSNYTSYSYKSLRSKITYK